MAAPSSTVLPAAATGPTLENIKVSFFSSVREVVSATVLQGVPVVAVESEAAGLVQEVPVVGIVCKTFLSFEQLVETATSNKDDLAVLRELCDVTIRGVLDKRSDRSDLIQGLSALENHVQKAEDVAKLCNVRSKELRRFVLARSICEDIASARNDVISFCKANALVLANDTHVSTLERQ